MNKRIKKKYKSWLFMHDIMGGPKFKHRLRETKMEDRKSISGTNRHVEWRRRPPRWRRVRRTSVIQDTRDFFGGNK